MPLKIDYKKLGEINWYRQGGAIKLFYVFAPYHCINETIGYDRNIFHQKADVNTAFFDRDLEGKKFRWALNQQIKDKSFIDKWIAEWEARNEKTIQYAKKELSRPVDLWTDDDLSRFLIKFNKLYLSTWIKGVILEWSDPDGHNILLENIKKYGAKFNKEEIDILISPLIPTYKQQEFMDRVKISELMIMGKNVDYLLEKHVKKFHCFENTWASVRELDEKYFLGLIKKTVDKSDGCRKETEKIRANINKTRMKKKKILKAKNIGRELENIFYMFQRMAEWRDERKLLCPCRANYYLYQILKRLCKENGISETTAGLLLYNEVKGWKISKKLLMTLEKRNQGAIYMWDLKKNGYWFYGKEAEKILNFMIYSISGRELKGVVANKGKAVGTAKIIETKEDFAKFKKGDILVANMTRPEYAPLMKIAGGIVTNEGGITCHAAIVSRELGKPCIIGTQVATEKLRDGDMVEVDAEEGIIKLLK